MEKVIKPIKNKIAEIFFILVPSVVTALLFQYILKFNTHTLNTAILTISFFIANLSIITRIPVFALSILLSISFPHAILTNGILKKSMLDVAISTNATEITQYYKSIPVEHITYSILLSLIFVLFFILQTKMIKIKTIKGYLFFLLSIIVAMYASKKIVYMTYYDDVHDIINEYKALSVSKLPDTSWRITNTSEKYNTYVVIIGESMRKDFMSLYGFNEKTTPFIDSIPKKAISNYISTAVNTTLSVPRVLSYSDTHGKLREEDNLITLSKLAGFKTYWISSQGYVGKYNISTSRISNYADFKYFNNLDDYGLIPTIKNVMSSPEKKVIFIHIFGSHEYPCERVTDYGNIYNTGHGELIDCYLSTYNKTDDFVKIVYNELKEKDKSYSLAYFSDHALNIVGEDKKYKIYRNDKIKQSYQIPFFIASSDDNEIKMINVTRSAYNFFNYFPEWIGVKTNLTPDGYDIFSNINDSPVVMSYDQELKPFSDKIDGLTISDIFK